MNSAIRNPQSAMPLGADAQRLLSYLQRWCSDRHQAQTDARIARALGHHARELIELRRELIRAGHIVVSENTDPQGNWLMPAGHDLAAAHAYAARLRHRGVEILGGMWVPLKKAIAAEEARRAIDSTGQRRMFS